ncbi:putative methyltransferase [Yarrowia sp. C11]|nr:putative methyltransferase [Yarrowia sp. C11]KAG5364122.1 putative methyltransferase [Yarrowia sp. E02]
MSSEDYVKQNIEFFESKHSGPEKKLTGENYQKIADQCARLLLGFEFGKAHSTTKEDTYDASVSSIWKHDPAPKVLDFAGGLGLVAQRISSYTSEVVGVDVSPKMVEGFNEAVLNQGITSKEMRALVADISKSDDFDKVKQEAPGGFNIVFSSLSFHHLPDVDGTLEKLFDLTKSGGTILIIDFISLPGENSADILPKSEGHSHHSHGHDHGHHHGDPQNHSHGHSHVVAHHHGFSEESITKSLEKAGYSNVYLSPHFVALKRTTDGISLDPHGQHPDQKLRLRVIGARK